MQVEEAGWEQNCCKNLREKWHNNERDYFPDGPATLRILAKKLGAIASL